MVLRAALAPSTASYVTRGSLNALEYDSPEIEYEDSDRSHGKISRKGSIRGRKEMVKKFACPFYKNNPNKYCTHEKQSCAMTGWEEIPRLKEHLTRCHTPKHSCKNCFEEFSSPHCRDDHIKAERCEKRKEPPPGRIAPKVSEELRSRKKTRRYQNDKDKWIEIYSRLFPGRPIPSPYFEPPQDRLSLQRFDNLEAYVRKEVQQRVRSHLDTKLGAIEEGLKDEFLQIVERTHNDVFKNIKDISRMESASNAKVTLGNTPPSLPCAWTPRLISASHDDGSIPLLATYTKASTHKDEGSSVAVDNQPSYSESLGRPELESPGLDLCGLNYDFLPGASAGASPEDLDAQYFDRKYIIPNEIGECSMSTGSLRDEDGFSFPSAWLDTYINLGGDSEMKN